MRRTTRTTLAVLGAATFAAAVPTALAVADGSASPRATKLPDGTPQQAGATAVPTLSEVGRGKAAMLAPVTISGRTVLMTVDTGAETTQIYRSAAGVLKLPKVGKPKSVTSIGCTSKAQPVALKNWKVGEVAGPDLVVSSTASPGRLQRIKKIPIVGLLGADALSSYGTVGVDFAHAKLLLGGTYTPSASSFAVKTLISKATKRPTLLTTPVTVRGATRRFAVDTGASQTTVEPSLARKARLRRAGKPTTVSAVSCKTKVQPVRVPAWKVGGVAVPGTVAASKRSDLAKRGIDGLVGAEVMASFGLVTFDYAGLHVSLGYPAAPPAPAPTPQPTPTPTPQPTPTTTAPTPPPGSNGSGSGAPSRPTG